MTGVQTCALPILKADLDYFRQFGLIEHPVTIEQSLDLSFLEAAVKELGPYKPK